MKPDCILAIKGIGDAHLALHEYREASRMFERALASRRDDSSLKRQYAFALLGLGRTDDAVDVLDAALQPEALTDLVSKGKRAVSGRAVWRLPGDH